MKLEKGQKIGNYGATILEVKTSADNDTYVLAVKEHKDGKEFITWLVSDSGDCYYGNYFCYWSYENEHAQYNAALLDLNKRISR